MEALLIIIMVMILTMFITVVKMLRSLNEKMIQQKEAIRHNLGEVKQNQNNLKMSIANTTRTQRIMLDIIKTNKKEEK